MKVGWFVLIVAAQIICTLVVVSNTERETRRRMFCEISDYSATRSRHPERFAGYKPEDKARIERVASTYYLMPELLAAWGPRENGWIMDESGYNGTHKRRIRLLFEDDPQCWPWASTAEMIVHIGMGKLQRPEELGPWMTEVGKQYNPKSAEWTRVLEEFIMWYKAQGGIPTTGPHKAKAKGGTR